MVVVRTKESGGPSPHRTMRGIIQPWPKAKEFVREWNEQQEETLPEDRNKEENVNLIKQRGSLSLYQLARGG